MTHCGFDIEIFYTASVHHNIRLHVMHHRAINSMIGAITNREYDLGQYTFTSSINKRDAETLRPPGFFEAMQPTKWLELTPPLCNYPD